jgi:hypothetical protein
MRGLCRSGIPGRPSNRMVAQRFPRRIGLTVTWKCQGHICEPRIVPVLRNSHDFATERVDPPPFRRLNVRIRATQSRSFGVGPGALVGTQRIQRIFQRFLFFESSGLPEEFSSSGHYSLLRFRYLLWNCIPIGLENCGSVQSFPVSIRRERGRSIIHGSSPENLLGCEPGEVI